MQSRFVRAVILIAASLSPLGCGEAGPGPATPEQGAPEQAVALVYQGRASVPEAEKTCGCRLEIVPIAGTVFHFGLDLSQSPPVSYPFQSTVAGVRVSIAELPITKLLNIRSDANGKWQLPAIKVKGTPLAVSFVYELAGYTTTKSQVFEIGDTGLTDAAVQFPTAAYYAAAKGQIEQQISAAIGAPYTLANVLVTTVAKSWGSMYSPLLPHGDPMAVVSISPSVPFPGSVGPIYFNADVSPDPSLTSTSVDGGVLFGNLAAGRYTVTASKTPFTYSPLTFAVEDDVPLYVASPPHALQGNNSSAPGQP